MEIYLSCRTTKNALDAFNLELDRSATNHLKLAADIKEQIEGPLMQMSQSHAQQRKKVRLSFPPTNVQPTNV